MFFCRNFWNISFKTKSDMILTPIPLPTSFILTQISLVVVVIVKKSTFAFLYPSADIKYNLYIQKTVSPD